MTLENHNISSFKSVHPEFRLNGGSFDESVLNSLLRRFKERGEAYEQSVGSFVLEWLNNEEYVRVQTSGSTGKPKIIKIKKQHMFASAKATAKRFKLPEKTTALLCLPADFIAGKMMLVRAMVMGWHIDLVPPQSNPLSQVSQQYDFCAMTPFQLAHSLPKIQLLKKLIVGGGAISTSLNKKIQGLSVKIYETYGMTETVTHIAARRVNPEKKKETPRPFKTLANVTLSQDGRECLVIKAPAITKELVVTNDLVKLITNKKFVWLGRVDNVINSGGVKLFSEQIEKKLEPLIEVPFFIAAIPDESLGERVALFVEQEPPFILEKKEVDSAMLSAYEFPKTVFTLPFFERTENGKVMRKNTVLKALNSKK